MATDGDTEEVLEEAHALDSAYATLLTPEEAVAAMTIRVPARGNRKLRKLLEKVEADRQLKAWWHVANVNAVVRLEIGGLRGSTSRSSPTSRSSSCAS